ncbi:menaquinone biosynthetic enzyme MqnA/MqnD family protein [Deinococcus roseus]|uniref:Chorismate dehydratase n=1 Tax=Deinococcus roseus TaxID=392414 RepID=A0ABQ2D133_9DEIO|nr:menaquinone biosynthesis protein [Deinococcus roseus]GGJ40415.1 chorismate dehydratase [Deinococcus roseus]
MSKPYRIGLIDFANVAPINEYLPESDAYEVHRGVPTEMNRQLLAGEIDLANISSFEFLQNAHLLQALPDFSVSVLGPVYSVNLFHNLPWEALQGKRIALTTQSATSVKLLEVLLSLSGIQATLERNEGSVQALLDAGYAGVLKIGDNALREWYQLCGPLEPHASVWDIPHGRGEVQVTDLSMRWYDHFGLPFAFAVWAYRTPPPPELVHNLRLARRTGLGELAVVAERNARKLDLPEFIVQHYLWNFRYHLEKPDRLGLLKFAELVGVSGETLRFSE